MPNERRDTSQIEITPEMIEVGVDALCFCNGALSSDPDVEYTSRSVFEAMFKAQFVNCMH